MFLTFILWNLKKNNIEKFIKKVQIENRLEKGYVH